MNAAVANAEDWTAVIARALCFISLNMGDLKDKPMTSRARHLEALGLTRKEAAGLLGTTSNSLGVQFKKEEKRGKSGKKR